MKIALAAAAVALTAGGAQAAIFDGTVDAKSAIYGPGITPRAPGSLAPVSVDVTGLDLLTIMASGMTGAANGSGLTQDADGQGGSYGNGGNTTITGANGVSGISVVRSQLFLAGVFVDSASLPTTGAGPSALSYGLGDLDFLTSTSLLNQAFFIGDGKNGSGVAQTFEVSAGADTLLLGFVDGGSFFGAPRYYEDNSGALAVTVDELAPIPLPAGLPLMLAGLGGLALLRRRG